MKAVIYARVSSKEQEDTGYSLDAQEKLLKEYATKHDLQIAKVFRVSESASGKQIRATFNEMLEFVSKKSIPIILCEKIDRLTRNMKDAASVSDWIQEDSKREVHFVKESFIVNKNTRAHENLVWDMKVAIARFYTNNLSEEVKKGLAEKLRQGWLPTKPPRGYKTIGEKGHKIHVIDEAVAPLINKMFELYATSHYSIKKLVEIMEESGLRSSLGRSLPKSRVASLLGDPFYIGKIRYNNAVHQGKHEPIISEELFEKVQQVMRGRGTPHYHKHFPTFRGMIRCAECKGLVTWETQKDHWYGHCNYYRHCTKRGFVRQEGVEEQLLPYFDQITIKSERLVEWIKKALQESHQGEVEYRSSARGELNKRYEAVQKRLEMMYEDKLDGKIDEEFYQKKFKQYTEEKDDLLTLLKRHDGASNKYYELAANVLDLAQHAKTIYLNPKRTPEERRILLNLIFSNLWLNKQELKACFTKSFDVLTNFAPEWNKIFEPQNNAMDKAETKACAPPFLLSGSPGRVRTYDIFLNREALYQLSYRGFYAFLYTAKDYIALVIKIKIRNFNVGNIELQTTKKFTRARRGWPRMFFWRPSF